MSSSTAPPEKKSGPRTERYLAWATKEGEMVEVRDMSDPHLLNTISLLRRKIAGAKLAFGKTSCSLLTLRYLEDEANERGLKHDDYG
jgi:hypothetical protein